MQYTQLDIFSEELIPFKFKKKIRIIEFFAGIGSTLKGLEIIEKFNNKKDFFEHYKICEWAYNSICSYNAIHIKDFKNYSEGKTKEELVKSIKGISINYNEPLTEEQLLKRPLSWLQKAYNNCKATNNLINIMDVKGSDLEINDIDKYEYLVSWSFPCQDLSLSGLGKGMEQSQKDGGTRSGLCHEFIRIIGELDYAHRPQVLIMENVPQIIEKKNLPTFQKIQNKLEEFGYKNYLKIINAKEYGQIPQNRKRCFMISIKGNYSYTFPKQYELEYYLKNFLEDNVNEKYYLSKEKIEQISSNWKSSQNNLIAIKNATKQGYLLAKEGDGIDISSRMKTHRGTVQKGMAQTLKTQCEVGVVLKDLRIRKLTPLECLKLMGFEQKDEQALRDISMSDSAIYHMAGDSIITTIMCLLECGLILDDTTHTHTYTKICTNFNC